MWVELCADKWAWRSVIPHAISDLALTRIALLQFKSLFQRRKHILYLLPLHISHGLPVHRLVHLHYQCVPLQIRKDLGVWIVIAGIVRVKGRVVGRLRLLQKPSCVAEPVGNV